MCLRQIKDIRIIGFTFGRRDSRIGETIVNLPVEFDIYVVPNIYVLCFEFTTILNLRGNAASYGKQALIVRHANLNTRFIALTGEGEIYRTSHRYTIHWRGIGICGGKI